MLGEEATRGRTECVRECSDVVTTVVAARSYQVSRIRLQRMGLQ
jgi:hypothetical protein